MISISGHRGGRERGDSPATTTKGKPPLHHSRLIRSLIWASVHWWKSYLCWPSVSLKGQGTSARVPPSADGCVSCDVDLEALNSQSWQTAAHRRSLLRTGGRAQREEREEIKSWLPGIQSHSSPCRSLVVWGRRALLVRSSLPLCLRIKKKRETSVLIQQL